MMNDYRVEFAKVIKLIKTAYPQYQGLSTNEEVELWLSMLKDIPVKQLQIAVTKWCQTEKFPPSIADLRSLSVEVVTEPTRDWGESWCKIINAVRQYGSYGELDALESFDEITRRTVEQIGWTTICFADTNTQMTNRANFRNVYNSYVEREKMDRQMSLPLRKTMQMLKGGNDNAESNASKLESKA